jgi:hypothetical protein
MPSTSLLRGDIGKRITTNKPREDTHRERIGEHLIASQDILIQQHFVGKEKRNGKKTAWEEIKCVYEHVIQEK